MANALKLTSAEISRFVGNDTYLRSSIIQLIAVLALAALVLGSFFPHAIWDAFVEYGFLIAWAKHLLSAKSRNLGQFVENLVDLAVDRCNAIFQGE